MAHAFDSAYAQVLEQNPPTRDHVISGDQAQTRVYEWRSEVDSPVPALLCLPGGGDTAAAWCAPARRLMPDRRVVAVDIPGDAGRSQLRSLANAGGLPSWLNEVVQGIGEDRVDVLAHSYGAQIAVACALADRSRIRSLTLLDPTMVFSGIRPSTALRAVPLLALPSPQRLRSFKKWETDGQWPPTPEFGRLAEVAITGPRPKTFVVRRPKGERIDELRELPGGVRVLFGTRSKYHDGAAVAEKVRRTHPWITVTTVPVAHHQLPFDYPYDEKQ